MLKESDVELFFDEDLHSFMVDYFGSDYQEDDDAQYFHSMQACDIRSDFERELIEWMAENAEDNPRIEFNPAFVITTTLE